MDFNVISEHFVALVILACLVIGYIVKHASFMKWLPNDDIPIVLAGVGAIVNLFVSGRTLESAVYGALMGFASTGLHEGFRKWVEGDNNN